MHNMQSPKKHKAEILLSKYGEEVFNKAIEYFCENDMHCTIEDFEKKLEEINNNQNKTI